MPHIALNIVLDRMLPPGGTLNLPYPEGKREGHFFSGFNHTLAVDGAFYRCPRDFIIHPLPDRIIMTWRGTFALQAGALLNLQLEAPGGDFYHDGKTGVTVQNMVVSPIFLVNLAAPLASSEDFYLTAAPVTGTKPLKLVESTPDLPRNVVIHASGDNSHCTFTVEGEDLYQRGMLEKIQGTTSGPAIGNKSFARVLKVTPSHPANGEISIGTGSKLGLPVFLPAPGFLMREIINGLAVSGGTIVSGEMRLPTATTGDCRGTYTPPDKTELNGQNTIHLLFSLPNPGNIGMPDYAG